MDVPDWLAHPLQVRLVRGGGRGRIHRFLWLRSRAVSDAKQELSGKDEEKSFRAESSNLSRS
jgi:hypothetical protein